MRFALLGDHPDGLDMARALVDSGRHQLLAYSGSALGLEYLRRGQIAATPIGDVEEILADPAIDAVIVAGKPADRPAQLRRALQSERHVLCVHPADDSPDLAYEAAMMQGDTCMILMPLLADALHPGLRRIAELTGSFRLLELEIWSTETALLETDTAGHDPGVPGWDVLRLLGGEIIELVGLAPTEELGPEEPVLLSGRFEKGGMFQATLLPHQAQARWRLTARTAMDPLELDFAEGWPGPARLTWRDGAGHEHEETWDVWNPWAALVERFEEMLAARAEPQVATRGLTWQDEVRCLELDDAARRSVERRRASTLEYQEATEEASFKGTMTLVGCAVLWGSLVLLIVAAWLPIVGWLILPIFGLFLVLQLLRWVLPTKPPTVGQAAPPSQTPSPQKTPETRVFRGE
jgi:predicted dehydrogenase